MKVLFLFAVAFAVGFFGSMYPGPVKLSVVQSVIQRNLRVGVWASVGASLPEIAGSVLAIHGVRWLQDVPDILIWFQWSAIPLLLLIGWLILRKKPAEQEQTEEDSLPADGSAFARALFLNLFNPQLIPFWLVTAVWFNSKPGLALNTFSDELAFVVGATAGSFCMNGVYAMMTDRHRDRILDRVNPHTIQLLMGWGFIALGVWQAVQAFA